MSDTVFEPIFFSSNGKNKYHLPVFIYPLNLKNTSLDSHWHNFLELIFITDGHGELSNNSNIIPMNSNEFHLINPCDVYSLSTETSLKGFNLGIDTYFCSFNGIDIQNYNYVPKFTDRLLTNKLSRISNLLLNEEDNDFFYADICKSALDLIIYITKHHATQRTQPRKESPVQAALNYINAHITEKLTVDEIALHTGFSKYYFSRTFKKATGYTVVDFINLSRCIMARNLFDTKKYTVTDVFNMFPFEDYTYFINLFKKHIGVSPSQYLKNVLSENQLTEKQIFKTITRSF